MKRTHRLTKKCQSCRQKRNNRMLRLRHRQRKITLRNTIFFWLQNDE